MEFKIYGYDSQPDKLFKQFAELGIHAVTGGADSNAIAAAKSAGLDYYVCTGAFGTSNTELYCQDTSGERKSWFFSSGCPNSPELRAALLQTARRLAQTEGITGIIIDGDRFASPASNDGLSAFFTCFCPHCMKKMQEMGLDAAAIRDSALAAYRFIADNEPFDIDLHIDNLSAWVDFRRACVTESLQEFFGVIKKINPALKTGIYIFTPMLAPFVGQNYDDISEICDFLSPMIYRIYPYPDGIACLDHELAAISGWFDGKDDVQRKLLGDLLYTLFGSRFDDLPSADILLSKGVSNWLVVTEAAAAARYSCSIPILMLEDEQISASVNALEPFCDEVDFFKYEKNAFEKLFPSNGVQ